MNTLSLDMLKRLMFCAIIILFVTNACQRSVSDLEEPEITTNPNVFLDTFSGGLEYAAFSASVPAAFQVDDEVTYNGTAASMRFEVPDVGDSRGVYAGGTFFTTSPRDLSGYDALTFYAKASQAVEIAVLGLGNDLAENAYQASVSDVSMNTNWKKYIIPLPDPARLDENRGMFFYSAAPVEGKGYTFWIDEMKYEKLGTIAHPRSAIMNGEDRTSISFAGIDTQVDGLQTIFNLPTGIDQAVTASPSYFEFTSSNTAVATVNESGRVSINDIGTAVITATLNGVDSEGSLTVESKGSFDFAPTPTQDQADVISLFSDAYNDVPVDYYNGYWEFSTTTSEDFEVNGDRILNYLNLNFVGIQFTDPTIDASSMTHLSMDVFIPNELQAGTTFEFQVYDVGPDKAFGTSDDLASNFISYNNNTLSSSEWIEMDIPFSQMGVNPSRMTNLAQIIIRGTNLPSFYLDNIYLFDDGTGGNTGGGGGGGTGGTDPTAAAPTPTQDASDVISMFSDAYGDVAVDTWRTEWSVADYEEVEVAGNSTKKYSNLDFVGVETVNNQIDASNMTHFNIDVWSSDFTQFRIKLVDFGPNGTYDGPGNGDDTEHEVIFSAPDQSQWVNYDIALSDFTNLTTTGNIAQLIFAAQPAGGATVYIDNVYFYNDGGNSGGGGGGGTGGTDPTSAAPTPTQDASSVVSMFSDAYSDVTVDTWRTEWSVADYSEITVAGNATKKYSNLDFVGIETVNNQIDASGMTHFRVDVWSSDFTQFRVKLVDLGPNGAYDGPGNGDDSEHEVVFEAPDQSQWVSLDIALSDFANLAGTANIGQLIFAAQPAGGATVYIDNVYFYNEDGGNSGGGGGGGTATEPTTAAPDPTEDGRGVISLFSDVYRDVTVDTWRTEWSVVEYSELDIAGNATKKYSDLDFVGIETVNNQIDASGMTHFSVDVWSADFTQFRIKLVDFGPNGAYDGPGNGDDTEHEVIFEAPRKSQWVSYDIPLTQFTNLTTTANIGQLIFAAQPAGAATVYIDNVYFFSDGSGSGGGGTGNEPGSAAPTPTKAASDVISMFSDAYSDITVDTWRTDWSVAAYTEVEIAGNATKKYSNLDFVGIETVNNQFDISEMNTFHVNVWSSDFTQFRIKLVDFGPNGAYDGPGNGDDTEHEVIFEAPSQGEWISYEIPLSDFVNLTTKSNIAQLIFVAQPAGGATVFIDNVYFSK